MLVIKVISVQYNGGFLPDIREELFLSLQPIIIFPPKYFDIPPDGECSRGLDAFIFFLKPLRFLASLFLLVYSTI